MPTRDATGMTVVVVSCHSSSSSETQILSGFDRPVLPARSPPETTAV